MCIRDSLCVARALVEHGHRPVGVRLDSGDLAYLSRETRALFVEYGARYGFAASVGKALIVASNDINEKVLLALNDQGHEIDAFGIGTNLVTCQAQPALGMVFKLVEINGAPRIKLSNERVKMTIPGKKEVYRLRGKDGQALLDVMVRDGEANKPAPGRRIPVSYTHLTLPTICSV